MGKQLRKTTGEGLAERVQDMGQKPGSYASLKRGDPCRAGFSQARVIPLAEKPGFFALWHTVMPGGMSDVSIAGESIYWSEVDQDVQGEVRSRRFSARRTR